MSKQTIINVQTGERTEATVEAVDTVDIGYELKRELEYPSLKKLADAMYWASKGDDSHLTAYYAACEAVKTKYPKPEAE